MASLATGAYAQDQMIPSKSCHTKPQEFLLAIDVAIEAFSEAKTKDDERLGVAADAVVDIAERSVEYRKANQTVSEPFVLVREYLDSLPEKDLEAVLYVLGDGEFIKHVRNKLAKLRTLLKNQVGSNHLEKLDRCSKACVDAEQVMQDGLMFQLRDAIANNNDEKKLVALEACFAGMMQDDSSTKLDKDEMLGKLNSEWEERNAKLKAQKRKSLGAMPQEEVAKLISEVVSAL